MIANAVYSSANAIPVESLHTESGDMSFDSDFSISKSCGFRVMSFSAVQFGRAWWFGGKYALVCFEVFILFASLRALKWGSRSIKWHVEIALHAACALSGLAAFVGFYVRVDQIEKSGWNREMESELQTNAYSYLGPDDDANDFNPENHALERYKSAQSQYVRRLQSIPCELFGVQLSIIVNVSLIMSWYSD
jgi:hypothetical protein